MSMLQGLAFNEVLSSVSEGSYRKQCDTAASLLQRQWKFTGVWGFRNARTSTLCNDSRSRDRQDAEECMNENDN